MVKTKQNIAKETRELFDLGVGEMATLMGVHRETYGKWERGAQRMPNVARRLCAVLRWMDHKNQLEEMTMKQEELKGIYEGAAWDEVCGWTNGDWEIKKANGEYAAKGGNPKSAYLARWPKGNFLNPEKSPEEVWYSEDGGESWELYIGET